MKAKIFLFGIILFTAAVLIVPVAADDTAPVLPFQVYGTITYSDGGNLPVGTVITATVDNIDSTYVVDEAGKIGGPGTFDEKFLINGTTNGSPVTFKINGIPAAISGECTFASGTIKQISIIQDKITEENHLVIVPEIRESDDVGDRIVPNDNSTEKPASSSAKKSGTQGSSIWLTETAEHAGTSTETTTLISAPTTTPTATPTVQPTETPTGKSPVPFLGILAGLGSAALLFVARKRR